MTDDDTIVLGGGEAHTAQDIVIATGSDPVMPPMPGLRELQGVWTNREATGMQVVPERLLILGAGPVASARRCTSHAA
jgi:dihydrolipoamide dehydrogenase